MLFRNEDLDLAMAIAYTYVDPFGHAERGRPHTNADYYLNRWLSGHELEPDVTVTDKSKETSNHV